MALLAIPWSISAAAEQKKKQETKELSIVKAELLDSEDGYPIPPDSVFFPGERVHLLFNIGGYTRGQYDLVKLSWRIESFGPSGEPFAMTEIGKIDTELAPQDKDWLPIVRHSPRLPDHGGGGTYKVVLTVVDELANQTVKREVPIQVEGESVEVTNDLTIRGFSFARSEGGKKLDPPVYRPGESVWASFYITGYQLAEDNSFNVESELKIFDEDGKVLFAFDPQGETGSPFYPRLWLPASFRLDLDNDIPRGAYSIQVSVHDKLAQKTYQRTERFTVE